MQKLSWVIQVSLNVIKCPYKRKTKGDFPYKRKTEKRKDNEMTSAERGWYIHS